MSNEVADADTGEIARTEVFNPFARSAESEQRGGTMQMQQRESADVLAAWMAAKRFPRDVVRAADRIQNAFTRPTLAEAAQYQFARGGQNIIGPSIRSAEAMAQQWGNMSNGWREIARYKGPDGVGVSEVEAFSTDYESGNRESIQFIVRHWRDTKSGGYALRDERDIYELCANQAQRRKRACILAQLPGDIVEMAMQQCTVTLNAKADTSPEGVARLREAFSEFGVKKEHIEKRIQRSIDAITPAQVVGLKRIYASLRDGMSEPIDWFEIEPEAVQSDRLDAIRAAAKQKRESKGSKAKGQEADKPPAAAPAPAPQQSAAATDTAPAGDSAQEHVEQPAADGGGLFDDTAYAEVADRINKAKTREDAQAIYNSAAGMLSPAALEDLAVMFNHRWPAAR